MPFHGLLTVEQQGDVRIRKVGPGLPTDHRVQGDRRQARRRANAGGFGGHNGFRRPW